MTGGWEVLRASEISKATISRYLAVLFRRRGQIWKAFLRNHADGIAAADFMIVPTTRFELLYVFAFLKQNCRTSNVSSLARSSARIDDAIRQMRTVLIAIADTRQKRSFFISWAALVAKCRVDCLTRSG